MQLINNTPKQLILSFEFYSSLFTSLSYMKKSFHDFSSRDFFGKRKRPYHLTRPFSVRFKKEKAYVLTRQGYNHFDM